MNLSIKIKKVINIFVKKLLSRYFDNHTSFIASELIELTFRQHLINKKINLNIFF